MDRAIGPLSAASLGGLVMALGMGVLPTLLGSVLLAVGLLLMFLGVAGTAVIRESHLAPVVATAAMAGLIAGTGTAGLNDQGVLAGTTAAAPALVLGVLGMLMLPWLVRDVRRRATEAG